MLNFVLPQLAKEPKIYTFAQKKSEKTIIRIIKIVKMLAFNNLTKSFIVFSLDILIKRTKIVLIIIKVKKET